MSFLDVLDSIGSGQRPAPPQTQQQSPPTKSTFTITKTKKSNLSTGKAPSEPPRTNGMAEEAVQSTRTQSTPLPVRRPVTLQQKMRRPVKPTSPRHQRTTVTAIGEPAALSAAGPRPGSYAALIANAKAAQQLKTESEVGLIKHQATSKERLSNSQKRKRDQDEKLAKAKRGKRSHNNGNVEKRPHNGSIEKRAQTRALQRSESTYKGTAKPAMTTSSYKGTAGRLSQHKVILGDRKHGGDRKARKNDEYLGTDEEDDGMDESDSDDLDDGHESDVSSDMEAGAFDVEEEESKALRLARADDAKEQALENKLRSEKEERRRRLEALSQKRR
jgi:protein SPT2